VKNLLTIFSIIAFFYPISAQDFNVSSIREELMENAYAVIRKDEISVEIQSLNKVILTHDFVITVMNKAGDKFAQPHAQYDPDNKISFLEAIYYDENGKTIKKFKSKDFIDQSYITDGQMYTENRVKYLNYSPVQYPYTLHFKSVINLSSTSIVSWNPIWGHNLAIENSSYTLNNLINLKIHSKELNLKEYNIESQSTAQPVIHYELKNVKAMEREELLPLYRDIFPNVEFSALEFVRDGVKGSFSNWEEMGKWYKGLLVSTNDLTPTQKAYFQDLVKDARSDKEKVSILYKHLQNKTRYVGVQLGIGGLKPFPASYVESKGYGDCKALTNYMKSILDAVGIKSYYTIVQAGKREDFYTDFASIAQGNHVILYVPLAEEDIWLETTSQQTAFNYLGRFTDDRNALCIFPEGGKIIRTQKFPTEKNTENTKGNFEILPDGKLKGTISSIYSGIQYDMVYPIKFAGTKEQKRILNNFYENLPNLTILKYNLDNNWDEAVFTVNIDLESQQFAKIFGENMMFNILPAGHSTTNLKKDDNRRHPFEISYGNTDDFDFEIKIPVNYKPEGNFEPVLLESEFGLYQLSVTSQGNNMLKVKRKLIIKNGIYPKEKFNDYVEFRRKISSFDNAKILLEKIN